MPNVIIEPNMNLPIPVVGVDPGPDWANNVNACLTAIGSHDHSTGKGVLITPAGLNINADLSYGGNNATVMRSLRLSINGAPLSLPQDLNCVYDSSGDLWFNDGSGNQVRITQGGTVTGSTGTITGLPSGTASAAYVAGTFIFQSATNTPAAMDMGPVTIGAQIANPFTVNLTASPAQAVNYGLTFPLVAPLANQLPVSDGAGNLSWSWGLLPIGSVIATFPNLAGAYSTFATTVADAYGFVRCLGQTIADATSPMNGTVIPNLGSGVFLLATSTAGITGGSDTATLITANLPSHTHTFTSTTTVPANSHIHGMAHVHQWDAAVSAGLNHYSLATINVASTTISSITDHLWLNVGSAGGSGGTFHTPVGPNENYFTTGVLSPPNSSDGANAGTSAATGSPTTISGTTDATGGGTAFSILPPYITAVYLMRIK